jgi:hypothetical protein
MEKYNNYTVLGLKALQRAADKVAENARRNHTEIPLWKNGRIEFGLPQTSAEQAKSNNIRNMLSP